MKEVKKSTIVGQAIETVEGFKEAYKKLHQQVTLEELPRVRSPTAKLSTTSSPWRGTNCFV